jgi:two-component system sensor histidine kinase DctS
MAIAGAVLLSSDSFKSERTQRAFNQESIEAEQAIAFELQRILSAAQAIAREVPSGTDGLAEFQKRSMAEVRSSPAVNNVWRVGCSSDEVVTARGTYPGAAQASTRAGIVAALIHALAAQARERRAVTSRIFDAAGRFELMFAIPVSCAAGGTAVLVEVISLGRLLEYAVPWGFAKEADVQLQSADGWLLARRSQNVVGRGIYKARIESRFTDDRFVLATNSIREAPSLVPDILSLTVLLLSSLLILSVLALWHDLNLRTRAEASLRRSLAFQKAMEESVVTGLFARDLTELITHANRALCAMVEASPQDLTPLNLYLRREKSASSQGYEVEYQRAGRTPLQLIVHEAPLLDGDGRQIGWMGSVMDITAQKLMQEHHRQQNERMHRMARLMTMGEMASGIAHELSQPLAAITGFINASMNILSAPGNTPARGRSALALLTNAKSETDRAGMVIRRVRELTRHSGAPLVKVNVGDLISDLLPLIESYRGTRDALQVSVEEGCPDIQGDKVLLQQVLLNLIKNAFEAMDDVRPADYLVELSAATNAQSTVTLSVTDSGPGLPDDFDLAGTASLPSTKADGMGVGLAICRSALEAMGSRLRYQARPGGGTVFSFDLQTVGR